MQTCSSSLIFQPLGGKYDRLKSGPRDVNLPELNHAARHCVSDTYAAVYRANLEGNTQEFGRLFVTQRFGW